MKLNAQFKATLIAIEENKTSDGRTSYYKIAVAQGAECTSLSCTKEVFEATPVPFKEYGFALQIGEYDGKTTFRVYNIFDISNSATSKPTEGKPTETTAPPTDNSSAKK